MYTYSDVLFHFLDFLLDLLLVKQLGVSCLARPVELRLYRTEQIVRYTQPIFKRGYDAIKLVWSHVSTHSIFDLRREEE